jgi:hypothetical protein
VDAVTDVDQTLTSSDSEPPPGTVVRDDCGQKWERYRDGTVAWQPVEGGDSESWVKVAGNYGPVVVLEWGEGE